MSSANAAVSWIEVISSSFLIIGAIVRLKIQGEIKLPYGVPLLGWMMSFLTFIFYIAYNH